MSFSHLSRFITSALKILITDKSFLDNNAIYGCDSIETLIIFRFNAFLRYLMNFLIFLNKWFFFQFFLGADRY